MDVLCQEFKDHYYLERPHQGLENELIQKPLTKKRKKTEPQVEPIRLSDIRCEERLGGLIKSNSRVAA
jgi:putative transposase